VKRQRTGPRDVLKILKSLSNQRNVEGMARFGINPENTYGVSMLQIRDLAKTIGTNHLLAQKLWMSGIHEARIQMERWVGGFDSWDVCDQCCMNLFEDTPFAYEMALVWSRREEEFVKRAGFVLMARLAVSDREAANAQFQRFFPAIRRGSSDARNYVKKAVSWALRQIGKRNRVLHGRAVLLAREIQKLEAKSARWVAADVLRELISPAAHAHLRS
jgi:3-methyladenine DNA glycosylase AlkD